jgi:hypothetical protein
MFLQSAGFGCLLHTVGLPLTWFIFWTGLFDNVLNTARGARFITPKCESTLSTTPLAFLTFANGLVDATVAASCQAKGLFAENEHVRDLNQLANQQTFSKEHVVSGNALQFDPPVGSSVGQVSTSTVARVVSTLACGNKLFCSPLQRLLRRESKTSTVERIPLLHVTRLSY